MKLTRLEEDYKGFGIVINDKSGELEGYAKNKEGNLTDIVATSSTLNALKAKLDEISKKNFNIPVLVKRWDEFKEGKITSILSKESYGGQQYFRIQNADRTWSEQTIDSLIKVTDKNKQIIKEIKDKQKQEEILEKEIEKLGETLEKFTLKELGVEKK